MRDNPLGGGGVGSPKGNRWGNAKHEPTPPRGTRQSHRWERRSTHKRRPAAPRPRYPLAEGDPKGALAGVQRTFSPQVGTSIALALGRGEAESRAVCKAITQPQTPPRRARRVNDFEGSAWGRFSHNDPSGAARRGGFSFSVVGNRERPTPEENGTTQPLLIAHEKNGTNHSPPDPRQPKNNREQTTTDARRLTRRRAFRGEAAIAAGIRD